MDIKSVVMDNLTKMIKLYQLVAVHFFQYL